MEDDKNIIMNEFNSSIGLEKPSFLEKNKKLFIAGISIALLLIIIIIIIIVVVSSGSGNSDEEIPQRDIESLGQILCTYNIKIINNKIRLLGNEFSKDFDFDISVDGKLIKYIKDYQFGDLGEHKVNYLIYDKNINLDYMFKDVLDLTTVIMTTNNNNEIKITSMISTFENCTELTYFTIKDFNIDEIKSVNKLFFNSNLVNLNMPLEKLKNIEDMSYMFAGTNLDILDLSK